MYCTKIMNKTEKRIEVIKYYCNKVHIIRITQRVSKQVYMPKDKDIEEESM